MNDLNSHSKRGIENPRITVDTVIFSIVDDQLCVLLNKRQDEPYKGQYALPGGFLWEAEQLSETVERILNDKTGLKGVFTEQLYTFDNPSRDPRGRILSVAYYAFAQADSITLNLKTEDNSNILVPLQDIESMGIGFDHQAIIQYAKVRVRSKVLYTNAIQSVLPSKFTFSELQSAYQAVIGGKLDKRNFRKKYLSLGLIRATEEKLTGKKQRPAQLFEFIHSEITELDSPFL